MKRTAAWVATFASSLLALSAGHLPAAPATAPAAPAAPTAGAGDPKAAPGTATELLASKGLTKNGTNYVLAAERDLTDGLKQVAVARTKMGEETRGRAKLEREVARAKSIYSQLEFEKRKTMASLETLKDPTMQNNAIAKINNLTSQMKDAVDYRDKQEAELNKVGEDNKTKYINLVIDLADAAEKAIKEYETLAADADVKSALEQTKSKLGPTAEFNANLAQVKRLRGTVSSETIEVKMEGGVPMVEVTLNKNFTRSMILDTGASYVAIPADLAKSMELVAGKDDRTVQLRIADGKVVEGKLVTLKSVRVGSFTIENVEAAVLPPELVAAEPALGGSFLQHFTYKLDPKAGKLHLAQFGTEGTAAKAGDKPGDKKPAGK